MEVIPSAMMGNEGVDGVNWKAEKVLASNQDESVLLFIQSGHKQLSTIRYTHSMPTK